MAFYIIKQKFIDGRETVVTATQSLKRAHILQKTLNEKHPEIVIETVDEKDQDTMKYWCVSFFCKELIDCYIVEFGNEICDGKKEYAHYIGWRNSEDWLTDVYVVARSRESAVFKAKQIFIKKF